MTILSAVFVVFVTFAFALQSFAQDPVMFDKFDRLTCSDIRARTDTLLATLAEKKHNRIRRSER